MVIRMEVEVCGAVRRMGVSGVDLRGAKGGSRLGKGGGAGGCGSGGVATGERGVAGSGWRAGGRGSSAGWWIGRARVRRAREVVVRRIGRAEACMVD